MTGDGIFLLLSNLRRGGGNATSACDGGGGSDLVEEDPNEADVACADVLRADVLRAEQGEAVPAMQEEVVDISLDDALEKAPARSILVTRARWAAEAAEVFRWWSSAAALTMVTRRLTCVRSWIMKTGGA